MNRFQKGVAQLLEKRGQIIIGATGYQYGGYDAQLNDTDYFVCDVDKIGEFDFAYAQSTSQFSTIELMHLLCGGAIKETSGHSCPEWQEIFYRNPAL